MALESVSGLPQEIPKDQLVITIKVKYLSNQVESLNIEKSVMHILV